ncbi:cellulose synthase subunit BcsC-related outer membrane protein [Alloalcanivorax venustensis]|uniref:cellulose biosynthesis protein BcsC n=1 Tax=Alloalcanivorax venustensis TaxID=172371 RepID=UPI0039C07F44|tara:strand:+ start:57377 stop:61768 length:4392 start_codon:yes stop_codon:yes gene_type:complete
MKRATLALPMVLWLVMTPAWAAAQQGSEATGDQAPRAGESSLDALFSQATFWRANNRPDLARDALERVLAVEPDNARALRGMGELALAADDRDGARQWLDRLRERAPGSEDAARLQAALRREQISNGDLMEARALAKAGDAGAAVARYEALFDGAGPPPDLALEYYQTLAGVDARWREARDGLQQVVRRNPDDPAARQALAEVLTYRQATRDQGIEQLAGLWRDQERLQVIAPWRQALLWLPQEPASADALRDYLAVRPDDEVVRERLDSVLSGSGGAAVADAYDALEAGRLSAARRGFQGVLEDDPDSAEAVAGLGLADLRQGRFGAAEQRLARSIRMAPDRRADWAPALEDARFYGQLAEARALNEQQNYDQALQAVIPLARAGGRRGRDAALLQGDILLAQDRPQVAETVFRDLLESDDANSDARVGLVRALMAQERYDEANRIYAELPAEERMRYGYVRDQQSQVLRERAQALIDDGQVYAGEALLHEAVAAAPRDPWARLALAKRMQARGQSGQAAAMLEPLEAPDAEPEALLAAAQFAADQGRWQHALDLLDRLPADARDSDSQALRRRVENGARMAELARVFDSGDRWRIQSELERLYAEPPETPAQTGQLANFLVERGESSLALTLVRKDLAKGLDRGAPKDFVPHALVLGRLGYDREAGELLRELERRAERRPGGAGAFADARRTLSVAAVDHARQSGDFARAYDEAVMALSSDPDNEKLVLALGRVYQEGGLHREAATTYDWLLARPGPQLPARRAAVANALAMDDVERAEQLLEEAAPLEDGELLLLAARTARRSGDSRSALALAEKAADAHYRDNRSGAPAALAGSANPFRKSAGKTPENRWLALADGDGNNDGARADVWLPGNRSPGNEGQHWQPPAREQAVAASAPSGDYYQPGAAPRPAPAPTPVQESARAEARIDRFREDVRQDIAPRVETGLGLRNRDGESGLSELTEVSGELAFSGVPFRGGRFRGAVTPTFLNAGSVSGSAAGRFGFGPLAEGTASLAGNLEGAYDLIAEVGQNAEQLEAAESAVDEAQTAYQEALEEFNTQVPPDPDDENADEVDLVTQEELDALENQVADLEDQRDQAANQFENATGLNVLNEVGIDLDALSDEQRAFVDRFLVSNFGSADFSLEADTPEEFEARSQAVRDLIGGLQARANGYARGAAAGNQTEAGMGVGFGYQGRAFAADIGSTPFGFEITNLVGGLSWAPKLGRNGRFILAGERRAVTDSLLSYAGVEDPGTGDRWGGVVRTGGRLGLTFDNGPLGLYGDLGFYHYDGHNVADNQSVEASLGGYLRPIREDGRELKTGVNVRYMSFDENLSKFTYGHGGYFSPQDYVSLSFPIEYSEDYRRWTWSATFAPGFQSYSSDAAAFFPTLAEEQFWMEILASSGVIDSAYYAAESESGFGVNLGAGLDYRLSPGLKLGTRLGYDTFGDYSETKASVNLNYTLEE